VAGASCVTLVALALLDAHARPKAAPEADSINALICPTQFSSNFGIMLGQSVSRVHGVGGPMRGRLG
jgi:hypothetical protein